MSFSPVTPPPVPVPETPVIQSPVMAAGALFRDLRESISEIRDVLSTNRRASRDRLQRAVSESPMGASMSGVTPRQTASPVLRRNLSPPHLRSRGRTVDLPRVMSKPIEYYPHQN